MQVALLEHRLALAEERAPGSGVVLAGAASLVLLLPAGDVQAEVTRLLAACCAARFGELEWRRHDETRIR